MTITIDCEKISVTMRSLFRLYQLMEMNSPDILIDTEKEILKKKFETLNADEIYTIVINWEEYKAKQKTERVVGDISCEKGFDSSMRNLN